MKNVVFTYDSIFHARCDLTESCNIIAFTTNNNAVSNVYIVSKAIPFIYFVDRPTN